MTVIKRGWRVIVYIIDFIFRLLHIHVNTVQRENILQFVKFGVVGLSNTAVSYIVYLISLKILQMYNLWEGSDFIIANIAAFIISVFWSFCWNRRYVFKSGEGEKISFWKALVKTYISYAFTGLFLNTVLSILWVRYLNIPKEIAPVFNILLNVPINYLMNKYWAFRKEKK